MYVNIKCGLLCYDGIQSCIHFYSTDGVERFLQNMVTTFIAHKTTLNIFTAMRTVNLSSVCLIWVRQYFLIFLHLKYRVVNCVLNYIKWMANNKLMFLITS